VCRVAEGIAGAWVTKTDAKSPRKEECAPDRMIHSQTITHETASEVEARILAQKSNPRLGAGVQMKVLMKTTADGSVEVVMPPGAAPDSVGFNLNCAFQRQRRNKMVARLQAKLAMKQTA
jgi:hypothetical protein